MATASGTAAASGTLGMAVTRGKRPAPSVWLWHAKNWLYYRWREAPLALLIFCLPLLKRLIPGLNVAYSETFLRVTRRDGTVIDYGLAGRHLITTAGKTFLASSLANSVEPELLKYHGYGTGTTAAAIGDTTLGTELTTQYATDSTRPTGSQATSTNTYTTVATLSPDTGGTIAVTEWGLFSASSGGTLLDRQVFSAVNLVAGSDSVTTTYVFTQG